MRGQMILNINAPVFIRLLVCIVYPVYCTFDMNIHQLQFVADHLTARECRRVAEALHETQFYLSHNVTGSNEPDVPCIDLLMKWNNGEGENGSVIDLSLRLKELGHKELAGKLTEKVFHEKAEKVQKDFLNDPFKGLIHTNSPLLEESALFPDTQDEQTEGEDSPIETTEAKKIVHILKLPTILAVVSVVACVIFILLTVLCLLSCKRGKTKASKRNANRKVEKRIYSKTSSRTSSRPDISYQKLQNI